MGGPVLACLVLAMSSDSPGVTVNIATERKLYSSHSFDSYLELELGHGRTSDGRCAGRKSLAKLGQKLV